MRNALGGALRTLAFFGFAAACACAALIVWAGTGPARAADALTADMLYLELAADPFRRPIVTVFVNGEGPFRFIMDTGANRTAISGALAERLGLTPHGEREIDGVTGAGRVEMVTLSTVRAGALRLDDVAAPIIDRRVLGDADGLLGVDAVAGLRVAFDFANSRVEIRPSGLADEDRAYIRLPGEVLSSGMAQVRTQFADMSVDAVIDTGADSSVGNLALRAAVGHERWEGWRRYQAQIHGVTGETVFGELAVVRNMRFGQLRLLQAPIVIADLHIFDVWGLREQPSLIVGMDVLQHADILVIDYGSGEVLLERRRLDADTVPITPALSFEACIPLVQGGRIC